MKNLFVMAFILFSLTSSSFTQTVLDKNETPELHFVLFIAPHYSIFDKEILEKLGIGNAFGWSLGLDIIFNDMFLFGSEFGWDFPNDKRPFTIQTTGDDYTSSIRVRQFTLLGGLKSPDILAGESTSKYLWGNLNIGYMWVYHAQREIVSDEIIIGGATYDQELDLDGGIFLQPEISYRSGYFGLSLNYRYFITSDYNSKIEIKLCFVGVW